MSNNIKEVLRGGIGDNTSESSISPSELKAGIKVEMEHTSDKRVAKEIAKDHLTEIPTYYTHLKKMEDKAMHKSAMLRSFEDELSKIAGFKGLAIGSLVGSAVGGAMGAADARKGNRGAQATKGALRGAVSGLVSGAIGGSLRKRVL